MSLEMGDYVFCAQFYKFSWELFYHYLVYPPHLGNLTDFIYLFKCIKQFSYGSKSSQPNYLHTSPYCAVNPYFMILQWFSLLQATCFTAKSPPTLHHFLLMYCSIVLFVFVGTVPMRRWCLCSRAVGRCPLWWWRRDLLTTPQTKPSQRSLQAWLLKHYPAPGQYVPTNLTLWIEICSHSWCNKD